MTREIYKIIDLDCEVIIENTTRKDVLGWLDEYVENMGVDSPNLSYQYVYDFSPLLEDRLLIGGYRLAYVLNMIFG